MQPWLARYLLERHEIKARQNFRLNRWKKTIPMPLIQEVDNHDEQAECEDNVMCVMCVEQKKLNYSKETATTSKVKSQPDKHDVGVQVNLPPNRPHPEAPAHLDNSNSFDTEDIDYFFPSGNPSTSK